jgi:hypothetical protein
VLAGIGLDLELERAVAFSLGRELEDQVCHISSLLPLWSTEPGESTAHAVDGRPYRLGQRLDQIDILGVRERPSDQELVNHGTSANQGGQNNNQTGQDQQQAAQNQQGKQEGPPQKNEVNINKQLTNCSQFISMINKADVKKPVAIQP